VGNLQTHAPALGHAHEVCARRQLPRQGIREASAVSCRHFLFAARFAITISIIINIIITTISIIINIITWS